MAELGAFGAVIKFALELEDKCIALYDKAGNKELADLHFDRKRKLEQVRRELLNEIMLEPITGLDSDNYQMPESEGTGKQHEEACARFYRDAIELVGSFSREITRILERLAKENESIAEGL